MTPMKFYYTTAKLVLYIEAVLENAANIVEMILLWKKKKKSIKLFLGFCFYISSCCLDCKDMGKQLQVLTFFSLG